MKNIYKILCVSMIIFFACNKEEGININNEEPEPSIITATETCYYNDLNIVENTTVKINCLLDLEGQIINVPEGVTLEFGGGDIFNGTLNFSSSGKIAGKLLNSNLVVEGDVTLISDEFNFFKSRWNIVEGETTSDIALANNQKLESLFFKIKELGGITFNIDTLDAYFEVTRVTSTTTNQNFYPSLEAVNLPSNFNLIMTEDTHLRIYPGGILNTNGGGILAVRDGENITVSGGNIHGDRDERFYTADEDGEQGTHLFIVHSGRNITINNIHFENGSGGSIAISSFGFPFNSDYNPTDGIIVSNCEFINSRRMAIALTDGKNVDVINNNFINTGQASTNSSGGEVGYAINIEPYRIRDENGDLKEYQKVTNALIKGNTETNSRGGFLTLTIGQDIIVEENNIGSRVVWSFVSGVRVRNNTFTATNEAIESWAFFGAGTGETVFDNEFSGNTISGYASGVIIGSIDADIYDNIIQNVSTGIQLSKAYDAKVYNNIIEAENQGVYIGNTTTNDSRIIGNTITTSGFLVKVSNVNSGEGEEDYSILIDDNEFNGNGTTSLYLSNGVIFSNNNIEGGVQVGDMTSTLIKSNNITPNETHGIRLYNELENITITNNTISEPTGADRFECILNESTTPNEVILSNNSCN